MPMYGIALIKLLISVSRARCFLQGSMLSSNTNSLTRRATAVQVLQGRESRESLYHVVNIANIKQGARSRSIIQSTPEHLPASAQSSGTVSH